MLIRQKIANLLNGVSQRTAANRPSSQHELLENMLSHRIFGLRRRPPTSHVATLIGAGAGGSIDRSAIPWAFWRRGRLMLNDALSPATDGEQVREWHDFMGNAARYWYNDGGIFHNTNVQPKRVGNSIQFGHGPSGDGSTNLSMLASSLMGDLGEAHMMMRVKVDHDPAISNAQNTTWTFGGNGDAIWPNTSGIVSDNFGSVNPNTGTNPTADLTEWHVVSVRASGSRGYRLKVNNETIIDLDDAAFSDNFAGWGGSVYAAILGVTGKFQVEDILIVENFLSTTQESAWYDYMIGTTDLPPIEGLEEEGPPPTGASAASYGTSFIHEMRDVDGKGYFIAIADGTLQVFDRDTGEEQTVTFPDGGADFLTSTKGWKAVSVGGTTYIVNLDNVVAHTGETAPTQKYEALLTVREADYSTTYTVIIDGVSYSVTTPDATSADIRADIGSTHVAQMLVEAMMSLAGTFSIVSSGSTIHIEKVSGADFTITASDGLSDTALSIVKGSVESFTDLPAKGWDGMIVQITGVPESPIDNYWVQFVSSYTPTNLADLLAKGVQGSWQECPAPGSPVALDAETMPWIVSRDGASVEGKTAVTRLPIPTTTSHQATVSGGLSTSTFLTANGQTVDVPIPGTLDGTTRTVTLNYDVNAIGINSGEEVLVKMYVDNGSGFSFAGLKTYFPGFSGLNEHMEYTGLVSSGAQARLELTYGSGSTPPAGKLAAVTLHRAGADVPGVTATQLPAVTIAFDPTAIYPLGTTVTIVVDVHTYTHVVTGGDATGSDIAAYFRSAIAANYTVTDNGDGSFDVSNVDGSTVIWTATITATLDTHTFYNPEMSLTPGDLVGKTLTNITDGSSGTITANSQRAIQVAALYEGTTNIISEGDSCAVEITVSSGFILSKASWGKRTAGDTTICPLPSFVGRSIDEIFFVENRLGMTAGKSVVMSRSGNLTNFMRASAVSLLANDPIDITSTYPNAAPFESAVEWNGMLVLSGSSGHQFAITGNPVLSPMTVRMDHLSSFPMGTLRPIVGGRHLYFARKKTAHTELMQYFLTQNGKGDAVCLTEDVPQYLTGAPQWIVGDAVEEFIAVRTSGANDTLWVYSFHLDDTQADTFGRGRRVMGSWSKWIFPGANIRAISMLDGVLSFIMLRGETVTLERMDLGNLPVATADHRDCQGATPVPYASKWRLSAIYVRDRNTDAAETKGRLQMRYLTINMHDTTDFTFTVTPDGGRAPRTYTFHSLTPYVGEFNVPVMSRGSTVTIEMSNSTAGGCAFDSVDWLGDFTDIARRV